jgi:hypothetical protein
MTASDVCTYLEAQRVTLLLTPEGELTYRAPRGVMTMVLKGLLKDWKEPLVQLLTTGEDAPLPEGASLPATDYSQFLTWQTGKVPASAQLIAGALPQPLYHDIPGPPETVLGPPCRIKGCAANAMSKQGQPLSTYYRRTRLCVRCYGRLRNTVAASQTTATGEAHALRLL